VRWRVIGWVLGEAFYKGRPTSYWSEELSRWGKQWNGYQEDQDPTFTREETMWDRFAEGLSGRRALELEFGGEELQLVNPEAVPVLLDLLKDSNPFVRSIAALCLGKIGPEARPAVPILLELFDRAMAEPEPPASISIKTYKVVRIDAACSREYARALRRIDADEALRCAVIKRRASSWHKRFAPIDEVDE